MFITTYKSTKKPPIPIINKNENYKNEKGIFIKESIFENCLAGDCKCLSNKCEYVTN